MEKRVQAPQTRQLQKATMQSLMSTPSAQSMQNQTGHSAKGTKFDTSPLKADPSLLNALIYINRRTKSFNTYGSKALAYGLLDLSKNYSSPLSLRPSVIYCPPATAQQGGLIQKLFRRRDKKLAFDFTSPCSLRHPETLHHSPPSSSSSPQGKKRWAGGTMALARNRK